MACPLQAHYGTLLRLKQYFPFSLIDAMGSVEECRRQIVRELRYQSSMDLEEHTYSAIRHLPLARELVRTSRQQLVSHLDSYCRKHHDIFQQVKPRIPQRMHSSAANILISLPFQSRNDSECGCASLFLRSYSHKYHKGGSEPIEPFFICNQGKYVVKGKRHKVNI